MAFARINKKVIGIHEFEDASSAIKNAEGILRSFKKFIQQYGNVELIMIGDKGSVIRNYAKSLDFPIGALRFLGEIPYTQVAAEMQKADCLVVL